MKRTKTEKGITLISLIITIVILMILVGVTINAIKGDGIIAYADNAVDAYNQAQTEEGDILARYEQKIKDNLPKSGPVSIEGKYGYYFKGINGEWYEFNKGTFENGVETGTGAYVEYGSDSNNPSVDRTDFEYVVSADKNVTINYDGDEITGKLEVVNGAENKVLYLEEETFDWNGDDGNKKTVTTEEFLNEINVRLEKLM